MKRSTPLKPKAKQKSAAMKRYHGDVAAEGCCVCGGPATVHHVRATIHGKGITKTDDLVIPLCPPHHQKVFDPKASDPISIEGLSHEGFYLKYNIDPLALAMELWERLGPRKAA
jgi:hypothetical protein